MTLQGVDPSYQNKIVAFYVILCFESVINSILEDIFVMDIVFDCHTNSLHLEIGVVLKVEYME